LVVAALAVAEPLAVVERVARFEGQSKGLGAALKQEVRILRTADRRMRRWAPPVSPVAAGPLLVAAAVVPARPVEVVGVWLPEGPPAWVWAPAAFWPAADRR